jgi:hypothetical protein
MSSIFISKALPITSADDIRAKFDELELGVIDSIDMKEYDRDGSTFKKFWIHYSSLSKEEHAVRLMERIISNEKRQSSGEIVPTGDIPRIVYGNNRRTGKDMYWQVFACKTPAERHAAQEAKLTAPKVRIVM